MAFVLAFLPWVVYWVLVGNAPFRIAVCVPFAVAVGTQLLGRLHRAPWRTLEVGSLAVFAVLVLAAFVVNDAVLERWLQPLSNAGLFLIALVGILVGRPFVREYAAEAVDEATAASDGFRTITRAMTWLWVVIFAGMTVSSLIPPLVDGAATIRDEGGTLSIVCYWVLPYALMGLGGLVCGVFPPWFKARSALVEHRSDEAPPVVPQPPPPADVAAHGIVLEVPPDTRHDQSFGVVVSGIRPSAAVELSAAGVDLAGRTWRSAARFTASASGIVDVSSLAPDSGDWVEPDPDAPLWAMRFAAKG